MAVHSNRPQKGFIGQFGAKTTSPNSYSLKGMTFTTDIELPEAIQGCDVNLL
jgi:hypothetical protein